MTEMRQNKATDASSKTRCLFTAPTKEAVRPPMIEPIFRNKTHLGQWSPSRRNAIADEEAEKEAIKTELRSMATILELDNRVVPINMNQLYTLLKTRGLGEPLVVDHCNRRAPPVLRFKKTIGGPNLGPRRRPSRQMVLDARYRAETARGRAIDYDIKLYPSIRDINLDILELSTFRARDSDRHYQRDRGMSVRSVSKAGLCLPAVDGNTPEKSVASWVVKT